MPERPRTNLHQKIRQLLSHTVPQKSSTISPIQRFEDRVNACFTLLKYLDSHISPQAVYQSVYDRHMSLLDRMVLGTLIEAFERFIKEIAIECVDAISPFTFDNRFEKFSFSGGNLAAQFDAGSVGRAMCESETWISNAAINDRFREILKPHFGASWEYLFPNESQPPVSERERATTLSVLWQVRHNITHNTGVLTDSDARRLTLMVKSKVRSGDILNPSLADLNNAKRFLVETAQNVNNRVGLRLADLLTERHQDDSSLFDPQTMADSISRSFQQSLTISGTVGNP